MSGAMSVEGETIVLGHDDEPPAPTPSDLTGSQLGRYLIVEHIGAGGMSDVYRAYDTKLKREVALKLLKGTHSGALGDATTRLLREAQAMAQLSHPNVLPVFDIGEHEEAAFLAMELVEGQTLSRWAKAADRSIDEFLHVYNEAGRGLAAAHERGFVHRDFKPGNVMLGNDGRVRVMDFGLVRLADEQSRPPPLDAREVDMDALSTELTQHGSVVGTPYFMAPEQHQGEASGPKADQYAFCVALFASLYGTFPFPQSSLPELVRAKTESAVAFPEEPPRQVPERVRQALLRGLRSNPDDRWPDMDALLVALTPIQPTRYKTLAAIVAVFGLGVGAAYIAGGSKEEPCSASAPLADVWTPVQADSLRSTLSGLSPNTVSIDNTVRLLDRWSEAWSREYVDACTVGRSQPTLVQPRTACLERHRIQARAMIDRLLETTVARDVEHARQAAESLPEPRECVDEDAVALDPATQSAVAVIDEELATLRADIFFRDSASVLRRAVDIRERAAELGSAPLNLRVAEIHGRAQLMHGQVLEAANTYERAYFDAVRLRDDRRAAAFALHMIGLRGHDLDDPGGGLAWSRHAEAWLDEDDSQRGELLLQRARLRFRQGDLEGALRNADAARTALEASGDALTSHLELSIRVRGNALTYLERFDEAYAAYDECVEIASKIYGPEHPKVATVLVNVGASKSIQGEFDEALEVFERARALYRAVNPNHPGLVETNSNVGAVLAQRGDVAASLPYFERAVEVIESNGGDATNLIDPLSNLAASYIALERYDEAVATTGRLLGFELTDLGGRTWRVHALHAQALQALERSEDALVSWLEAVRNLERMESPPRASLAEIRTALGNTYAALGDDGEAERQLALAAQLAP